MEQKKSNKKTGLLTSLIITVFLGYTAYNIHNEVTKYEYGACYTEKIISGNKHKLTNRIFKPFGEYVPIEFETDTKHILIDNKNEFHKLLSKNEKYCSKPQGPETWRNRLNKTPQNYNYTCINQTIHHGEILHTPENQPYIKEINYKNKTTNYHYIKSGLESALKGECIKSENNIK